MGAYRVIRPDDPVWFTLMMMGFEESLLMFGSEPDLAEEIFATYTRFSLADVRACSQAGAGLRRNVGLL